MDTSPRFTRDTIDALTLLAGAIEVARVTGQPVREVLRACERDAAADCITRDEAIDRSFRRAMSGIETPGRAIWPRVY